MKNLRIISSEMNAITGESFQITSFSQSLILLTLFFMTSLISCAEVKKAKDEAVLSNQSSEIIEDRLTVKTQENQNEERVSKELLINYLKKQELIADIKNYKLELTNEFFSINGKKQPKEIHAYILKNFVKRPEEHLQLTMSVSTD